MGRNEIKLRRQRMTARGIDRYRNYNSVLKRHEDSQRIKKITKVFGLFAVILIVIMLVIFLSRWERRSDQKAKPSTASILKHNYFISKTVPIASPAISFPNLTPIN